MTAAEDSGDALVLVTGFGAFEEVRANPSGAIAAALRDAPPPGVRVVGGELPVSFVRSAQVLDELLEACPRRPDVLLALGVHGGGDGFALERRARPGLDAERVDNDGRAGDALDLSGHGEVATGLDLERLAAVLRAAGAPRVRLSEDAGRYVCERVYHHLLVRAAELGAAGLFLHVPPVDAVPLATQVAAVRALVAALSGR
jgi:pyroglutamyl-peptidase